MEDVSLTRRELFRSGLRGAVLLVLGLSGLALLRSRRGLAGRQTCSGGGICRGCPGLEDCGLPQGLSLKAAVPGRSRHG